MRYIFSKHLTPSFSRRVYSSTNFRTNLCNPTSLDADKNLSIKMRSKELEMFELICIFQTFRPFSNALYNIVFTRWTIQQEVGNCSCLRPSKSFNDWSKEVNYTLLSWWWLGELECISTFSKARAVKSLVTAPACSSLVLISFRAPQR